MTSLREFDLETALVCNLITKFVGVPNRVKLAELSAGTFEALAHGLTWNAELHKCLVEKLVSFNDSGIKGEWLFFDELILNSDKIGLIIFLVELVGMAASKPDGNKDKDADNNDREKKK